MVKGNVRIINVSLYLCNFVVGTASVDSVHQYCVQWTLSVYKYCIQLTAPFYILTTTLSVY